MALDRVTVFGGSGFLGRHIVKHLVAQGAVVRVATRHPDEALFLKPMGNVGQIVPVRADVRDANSVAAAVAGADAVVNAVGLYRQWGRATFSAVHEAGAREVAGRAAEAGVGRLVHISGIGVSATSDSGYVRSRAEGEVLVQKAFAGVTILRPSVLFGPEDSFFNKLAALARLSPVLPLFGGGGVKVQPVYVGDVARAVAGALADASSAGKVYELGGPRTYTYAELMRLMLAEIRRARLLVPVPFFVAEFYARFLGMLPNPLLTRDQVKLMKIDSVVGAGAEDLEALGVAATSVESILPTYMDRFRRGGRSSSPRLA